jgi:hypothetical protein
MPRLNDAAYRDIRRNKNATHNKRAKERKALGKKRAQEVFRAVDKQYKKELDSHRDFCRKVQRRKKIAKLLCRHSRWHGHWQIKKGLAYCF